MLCKKHGKKKDKTQFSRKSLKQSSALACWYNVHILEIMIKTPISFKQSQSNRHRQSWLCGVVIGDLRSFRTLADQVLSFGLVAIWHVSGR